MTRIAKKRTAMASAKFVRIHDRLSKAALIDALWCACLTGTDGSSGQILSQAARNALCACKARGDHVHAELLAMAARTITEDDSWRTD